MPLIIATFWEAVGGFLCLAAGLLTWALAGFVIGMRSRREDDSAIVLVFVLCVCVGACAFAGAVALL